MKRQFAIGVLITVLLSLPTFAGAQTTLIARLSGAQETPPVATQATGLALLTLDPGRTQLSYDLIVTGLVGITASHIHLGEVGVNGPVIIPLAQEPFTHIQGTVAVTAEQAAGLLAGGTYVNVHTAAFPAGEIRGQVVIPPAGTFVATLTGGQEVPPVVSVGGGIGIASLNAEKTDLTYDLIVTGLTGITASHFHQASAGVSGPVVIPIANAPFEVASGSSPVTPEQVAALEGAGLYLNVHTEANPSGEIRGQVVAPLRDEVPASESTWEVSLSVTSSILGASIGSPITIGTRPEAVDVWAPGEDIQGPVRPPSNFATLAIVHPSNEPGWEGHGGLYQTDLRAPIPASGSKTWERVALSSDLGSTQLPATYILTWNSLAEVSSALTFSLVEAADYNNDGVLVYNMRDPALQNRYVLTDQIRGGGAEDFLFNITVSSGRPVPRPVITNPVVTTTSTGATITWTTNIDSTAALRFGTAADALNQRIESDGTLARQHTITVANLTPNTSYFFQPLSTAPGLEDAEGDILTATTKRVITQVGTVTPTDITTNSAVIAWENDIPTTGKVFYGTDPNNLTTSIDVTDPTTAHSVTLPDLTPSTLYTVRIVASAEGAEDLTLAASFTTRGPLSVNPPTITNIAGSGARVTVTTSTEATVVLRYGTPDLANALEVRSDTPATSHVFDLTNLTAGAPYKVQAVASAPETDPVTSTEVDFTTINVVSVLEGPTVTVDEASAVITFTTDVNTTGEVRYGPTPDLGSVRPYINNVSQHNVALSNLQPNTTYYYQVVAGAEGRETFVSQVLTFTTSQAIVRGDVNGDNRVDMSDVILTIQHVVARIVLTADQINHADVVPQEDGAERLDLRDVTRMLRFIVGIINTL